MRLRNANLLAAALAVSCRSPGSGSPDRLRGEIEALQVERQELRLRLDELVLKDSRLQGMPETTVRVGLPTAVVQELIEKVVAGLFDQITLELENLEVRKSGSVKRIVTLGQYELKVHIDRVSGRLKTGKPQLRFGGNRLALALPVTVASGSGRARIDFRWNGKNVGGAVCGDLAITREVSGTVRPDTYTVAGAVVLSATDTGILATPAIPKTRINLKIEPSRESWQALQAVLDEKSGPCGFVLDRVDLLKVVRGIVDKGFSVGLPTDALKPLAVPVSVEPSMEVRGRRIELGVRVSGLAITPSTVWLGADVSAASFPATR